MGFGMSWVVLLLLSDAVISPGATGMTYMGVSARVAWMMGRLGLLPRSMGRLNQQAVPVVALLWSLLIGVVMLLGGPSWQRVVSFLTATLVVALAVGPVSLLALRRQLPHVNRAFRLPWAELICPLTFVAASWAVIWCGRSALEGAILLVVAPALLFGLLQNRNQRTLDAQSGWWWFLYLGGLLLIAECSKDGPGQLVLVALFALAVFPVAVRTRLPRASTEAQVAVELTP